MFAHLAGSGRLRFAAGFVSALVLLAVIALSVSLALAATGNVTLQKSENAGNPVNPGDAFTYTIDGNVTSLPVTSLVVKDSSIDDPQVTATSASWSVSGGASGTCVITTGSNVTCTIGAVAATTAFQVLINVTVDANPDVACLMPGGTTLDDTLRNAAGATWTDADGSFTAASNNVNIKIDCSGSSVPTPTPSPTPTTSATATPTVTPTATPTATPSAPIVDRIAGFDRYDTAALLSKRLVPTPGAGVNFAYIATGAAFPDALAGGPAAHERAASILLVKQASIPPTTAAELNRLKPNTIYVLGGSGAVSNAVLNSLKTYARSGNVFRLSGVDRYGTASAIVADAFPGTETQVMVSTGADFPDALAGGAAAAENGMPILLVKPTSIPVSTAAQLNRLNPTTIWILGGTGAVSTTVEAQLHTYAATVTRLSGTDRYQTAIKVSQQFFTPGEHASMYVATGVNFPDALAAGAHGLPMLLTRPTALPVGVGPEATRLNPTRITVLGGTSVVSNAVVTQLRNT